MLCMAMKDALASPQRLGGGGGGGGNGASHTPPDTRDCLKFEKGM